MLYFFLLIQPELLLVLKRFTHPSGCSGVAEIGTIRGQTGKLIRVSSPKVAEVHFNIKQKGVVE